MGRLAPINVHDSVCETGRKIGSENWTTARQTGCIIGAFRRNTLDDVSTCLIIGLAAGHSWLDQICRNANAVDAVRIVFPGHCCGNAANASLPDRVMPTLKNVAAALC